MNYPSVFAQFSFPSSEPPKYTARDTAKGLWENKYSFTTDTQYYNIHDLEMEDGIKSDFPISKTPDLMVVEYTPRLEKERLVDELLAPRKPTIFIVPGGGFFLEWPLSLALTTDPDDCTQGLPDLLVANGFKVFVFHYLVNENDPPLLRIFDIPSLFGVPIAPIPGQIITPQVADKYRFEQASIRSFWSFRKVMRTDYLNKADTLGIDTTQMIIAAHSAGAILALYNTFLNSAEIPTNLCGGQYSNCAIQSAWRNDYFNLPKFRGVMALAGASKFDNIFDNDVASINAAGTKLLLMHGTCDELLNEHGGKVPWRNNMPERDLYTHAFSLPGRYTEMIGSASIFKKLAGKITVRFEEGCEAGHDLTKQAPYTIYGNATEYSLNHGTWNFCDFPNPTTPSNINTNHFVYAKILDFANRVLFNSPAAFTSAFTRFDPELPYFECQDTTTICIPTNIKYDFLNGDCTKRVLKLEGGACLDKAILYFWRFKTLPSGAWSAYQSTTSPQFDLSTFTPTGAYTIIDVVALNACDTVYKRDTIQFCNLCVGGCNPNRMANQSQVEQIISFQYPNYLAVSSTMEGNAQLQLIDIKGVIIKQWTEDYKLGENKINIPINLDAQPPGMYFIQSLINNTTKSIKIIIP